ncbi:hypothetical protein [Flavobacterium phage V157]|uniref:Uncharacterized protein n=12 Tax=Ficleduovirus FCV1 TaxID=2560474 RepID=A0A218M8G6_9CAUD|nr:RecT-like ssDNA annealing protein [Flavobacterium phage FCV-1]ASD51629.1 hypothetical protein [Flavobacterium phage FCV-3]ASD51703.1 hypothetical protein [Flavobacterium phage FCV-11]ASD51777.1 hypothetical protein [Flavobacterium phage V175]ASD51855.1 hypothetical protein [Flavobacterium phage V181]ASD52533.1 hypothetical protein [Flavobacterium phage FCV-10]ASD52606.1 hypothetical protein [Flavobacterium phage FCV-16]ASD52680.1 hypothetical protein [Flavobacterium phage FCV-20]ASD52753
MSKEISTQSTQLKGGAFSSMANFQDAQSIASMLSKSDLVPASYKNNIPNTMIALEMANRLNISPFEVMQNLDIIKGKPSWNSTFIIASINSCGRFKPLRFEFIGTPKTDEYGCRAYTEDLEGNKLVGPTITWLMVKSEGWLSKAGSKWQTMPELMFQYRAASFFGRLYAPDILKGMQSVDEVKDVVGTIDVDYEDETRISELRDLFNKVEENLSESEKSHAKRIIDTKESTSYDKLEKFLKSKIDNNGNK